MKCKCTNCEKTFKSGNAPDGTPNGVGLVLQNGKQITLCRTCIIKLGMMSDTNKNKFIAQLEEKVNAE